MQMEEAMRLNEEWGDKLCNHPRLSKEYALGAATGDHVCTQCGQAGWGKHWADKGKGNSKSK